VFGEDLLLVYRLVLGLLTFLFAVSVVALFHCEERGAKLFVV
jgi:hypothetical protein